MKIVIPGGTGFLGTALAKHFHNRGDEVVVLSRKPQDTKPWKEIAWDGKALGDWVKEIEGADVVVNLAGRSVNCRYNARNKEEIYNSRLDSTKVIGEAIAAARTKPKLWINSSTATIYRHAEDRPMDEDSGEIGHDFSMNVAQNWERVFREAKVPFVRKVALRSAIVLDNVHGSAFWHELMLARKGLGGRYGSGRQMVSWVHIQDWLRAIDWIILHRDLEGPINVASPHPVTNNEFMRTLREVAGVKVAIPLYPWMLEIGAFFLRTETELLLKSRWVLPKRLLDSGFKFQFPIWESAAQDLVRRQLQPTNATHEIRAS